MTGRDNYAAVRKPALAVAERMRELESGAPLLPAGAVSHVVAQGSNARPHARVTRIYGLGDVVTWTKHRQLSGEKTSIGLAGPSFVSRTARSPGATPTSTQLPAVAVLYVDTRHCSNRLGFIGRLTPLSSQVSGHTKHQFPGLGWIQSRLDEPLTHVGVRVNRVLINTIAAVSIHIDVT